MEEFENILIVKVIPGDDKPYSCSSGFYTRIGPNAQKMSRDKIIEFFKSEGRIKFDELINLKFEYKKDFDKTKLEHFLRLAKISPVIDVPSILLNLGVAEKQEGSVIFNNAGILFFAKDLGKFYRHAKITCALYKGIEKNHVLDRKDFNEDVVSNIDKSMLFLGQHIPVRYEFDGSPQRKEFYQIPLEALREAIINAVCHRNYFEYGANIMVEIFDDRIDISSPGGLVPGLTEKEFGTKSVLRNPNIAALFHRIEYIEQMGTGINRMQGEVKEYGLKPISFTFTTFVTATFDKGTDTIEKPVEIRDKFGINSVEIRNKFGKNALNVLESIKANNNIKSNQIAEMLSLTQRTVEKKIAELKNAGIIKRVGSNKTGYWEIVKIAER